MFSAEMAEKVSSFSNMLSLTLNRGTLSFGLTKQDMDFKKHVIVQTVILEHIWQMNP